MPGSRTRATTRRRGEAPATTTTTTTTMTTTKNVGVVAGTVVVEIVDDGSSCRGHHQNGGHDVERTLNRRDRATKMQTTRTTTRDARRSTSGLTATTATTMTSVVSATPSLRATNREHEGEKPRRATRVVQNATVFENETVKEFVERCLERRKSTAVIRRDDGHLYATNAKNGHQERNANVVAPQLFWSSCPLAENERLDKLESTKPWQLNLKKGNSRLTLRVKDFNEWMIDAKKMMTTTRTMDADGAITGVVASGDKEEEEEEKEEEEEEGRERLPGEEEDSAMKDNDNNRSTPRRLAVSEANTNDEENEKLNELQKHQAELLSEYKARVRNVRRENDLEELNALGQEWEKLRRKYRETIENVLKTNNPTNKGNKNAAIAERLPLAKKPKKSNPVYNDSNNNNNNNNNGMTEVPAEQLKHYQTVLKAAELLIQKDRQKAFMMKLSNLTQYAPKIPDTPTDFDALISGKDACLNYKPPLVPEYVPASLQTSNIPKKSDSLNGSNANNGLLVLDREPNSEKRPPVNGRGTKRMRSINELNEALPTMYSHNNKRAKSNAKSRYRPAATKRAALQTPDQLAKMQKYQQRQYSLSHQQQLHKRPRKSPGTTLPKGRRTSDKFKPEFERALAKKKQEKEREAMQSDIGAMDGLLKLAHAANASSDTQWVQQRARDTINRVPQEERERKKRKEILSVKSSNDDAKQLNEDIAHIKSARAYSEALERARENPGAFLRKKDQMLNTNKTERPAPPALYVQKLLEMQMQQKLARLRGENEYLQKVKGGVIPSNADLLRAPRSIPSPNPFALYTINAGVPHLSADDERRRVEMLVQARVQQELLQHRAGPLSSITKVQEQVPDELQSQSRAILQPRMQPQVLQTTLQSLNAAQQNIPQRDFPKSFTRNFEYSTQLEKVSRRRAVSNENKLKHMTYVKELANLKQELGMNMDDSSDDIPASDSVRINSNGITNPFSVDAPNKRAVDMEKVMKASKYHAAQEKISKDLRSIYKKNVADFLNLKNGGAAIPTPPTTTMDVLLTTLNQRQQQPAVINPFKEGETKRGNGEEEPALKDGTI